MGLPKEQLKYIIVGAAAVFILIAFAYVMRLFLKEIQRRKKGLTYKLPGLEEEDDKVDSLFHINEQDVSLTGLSRETARSLTKLLDSKASNYAKTTSSLPKDEDFPNYDYNYNDYNDYYDNDSYNLELDRKPDDFDDSLIQEMKRRLDEETFARGFSLVSEEPSYEDGEEDFVPLVVYDKTRASNLLASEFKPNEAIEEPESLPVFTKKQFSLPPISVSEEPVVEPKEDKPKRVDSEEITPVLTRKEKKQARILARQEKKEQIRQEKLQRIQNKKDAVEARKAAKIQAKKDKLMSKMQKREDKRRAEIDRQLVLETKILSEEIRTENIVKLEEQRAEEEREKNILAIKEEEQRKQEEERLEKEREEEEQRRQEEERLERERIEREEQQRLLREEERKARERAEQEWFAVVKLEEEKERLKQEQIEAEQKEQERIKQLQEEQERRLQEEADRTYAEEQRRKEKEEQVSQAPTKPARERKSSVSVDQDFEFKFIKTINKYRQKSKLSQLEIIREGVVSARSQAKESSERLLSGKSVDDIDRVIEKHYQTAGIGKIYVAGTSLRSIIKHLKSDTLRWGQLMNPNWTHIVSGVWRTSNGWVQGNTFYVAIAMAAFVPPTSELKYPDENLESKILNQINSTRSKKSIDSLTHDNYLRNQARIIARNNTTATVRSSYSDTTSFAFSFDANVYVKNEEDVIALLKKEVPAIKNIFIDDQVKAIGIGFYSGERGGKLYHIGIIFSKIQKQ